MNRGEIRDMARKSLGETTAAFWSDAELNLYINTAGHDIADKTKCLKTNSYLVAVAEQADYAMVGVGVIVGLNNALSITEVYFKQNGTTWVKLKPTSRTLLDNENQGWMSAPSGVPDQYIEDMETGTITLYPKPNSTNAGTYIRVFYSQDFTDITSDSAETGYPVDLELAMVDFVTAYGFQQRGWGDKSNDSWSKYFNRLKEYMIERGREKEDYVIQMRPYRR